MTTLPTPVGRPRATALGMDQTGSLIVGATAPAGVSFFQAAMWVDGVPIELGAAPGFFESSARAVNAAGTVVAGEVMQGATAYGAIWTPDTGMILLQDYLAIYGVTMPGHISSRCVGISEDGRTIVGNITIAPNQFRGFVATVPTPATALPLLGLLALRRSRGTARPRSR